MYQKGKRKERKVPYRIQKDRVCVLNRVYTNKVSMCDRKRVYTYNLVGIEKNYPLNYSKIDSSVFFHNKKE